MKKILFVIIDFEIGGAQNALVRHINMLDHHKYKISVVLLSGKGCLQNKITTKNVEFYEANLQMLVCFYDNKISSSMMLTQSNLSFLYF